MFKLVSETAEEPEIKLPTSTGSWKKQESSRKTSISAFLTMPKPLTVCITINCGKFFKRWDHLTYLLRNLYTGQETTVRTGHGTTDWFQIGKGVHQGCILSPTYLTYMQSTSCWTEWITRRDQEFQEKYQQTQITDDTTLIAESKEKLKNLWWRWKRRVKSCLKTQHSEN